MLVRIALQLQQNKSKASKLKQVMVVSFKLKMFIILKKEKLILRKSFTAPLQK